MSFFYVSSVIGTRTTGGGYATAQTGSFAALGTANVYASIMLAIADGASDADAALVSDAHAHATAATNTLTGGTVTELVIQCVDDLNCDIESTGAIEYCSGTTADITFGKLLTSIGVDFHTADLISIVGSGSAVRFFDCTLKLLTANNYFAMTIDGVPLRL